MKIHKLLATALILTACSLTGCEGAKPINISGENTIIETKSIEGTITNKFTDSYTKSGSQFFYKTDNFVMPIGSENKVITDYYFTVTDSESVSVMFEVDVLTYNAYSMEQTISIEKKVEISSITGNTYNRYYLGGEKIVPVKKLKTEDTTMNEGK